MTIQGVISFLVSQGKYRVVDEILRIAELEFQFEGALLGPGEQGGLVLVLDPKRQDPKMVLRRISAFARVLARTESRRPMTAVLLNPGSVSGEILESMESTCRVLPVEDAAPLDIALRGLLPLRLPNEPIHAAVAADVALRERIATTPDQELTADLIEAASKGADEVRRIIRDRVTGITKGALEVEDAPDD